MSFESLFRATQEIANPPGLSALQRSFPEAWVQQALSVKEGTSGTFRRRRLPSEQVVWLVIAMGLFRDLPIAECEKRLALALPGVGPIAKSSVSESRKRLCPEAVQRLFSLSADAWATASAARHAWRGLSVYGIDGTTVRVADTPENRDAFPGHPARNNTEGSYPLVRLVVLMALRSHLLLDASFGPHRGEGTFESHMARPLLAKLPEHSLTIVDKAYLSAEFLLSISSGSGSKHWMTRAKRTTSYTVLKKLGKDDELILCKVSDAARRKNPELPETWTMRRITYRIKGFRPASLLTSLEDAERYPARELIALYHERWDLELAYRELKTSLLERQEALRSKSPELVKQELWGILLAYNLVRVELDRVALSIQVTPSRLSFVHALRAMRLAWHLTRLDSPGAIPLQLQRLRCELAEYILPDAKRPSYPRAVKIKMSNYPRKKPPIELRRRSKVAK
jgi:hypothetical protein